MPYSKETGVSHISEIKNILKKKDAITYLSSNALSLFEIYWVKSNGNKLKVHSEGVVLSPKNLKRIMDAPASFEFIWKVDTEWIIDGIEQVEKLIALGSQKPQDLIAMDDWRVEFINWIGPALWHAENEKIRYLDLVVLTMSILEIKSKDFYTGYDDLPLEVQARNLVVGSTISLFGIIIGYNDLLLIEDIFKTFIYLDYIYSNDSWTQRESTCLQKINQNGIHSLGPIEKEDLKESIVSSLEMGQQIVKENLNNPYIADYLKWSLEDFKGNGLAIKVKMNEMSDLELLITLVLQGIQYEENLLSKKIGLNLNTLFLGEVNLSDRMRRVVTSSIQVANQRNNNFLKISGL